MSGRRLFTIVSLIALMAIAFAGCGLAARAGGGPVSQAPAGALQASGNGEPMPRTVSVNGIGIASAKPDVAYIELGVESIDPDAAKAIEDNTTRMTAVMGVLTGMGLAEKDVQTVNYNMFIEQIPDKDGRPTGEMRYHVVNHVRVKLGDLSKAGDLLGKVLRAGANSVNGISFTVADPTSLEAEARGKAIADAKARAEQLATGLGAKLGALRQVSEFGGGVMPGPMNTGEAVGLGGGGNVPVSAGELNVTVQIQVTFDIAQ